MAERKIDRTAVRTVKLGKEKPSSAFLLETTTAAERIGMVWPLTKTAWAFKEAGERSRAENGTPSENQTPRAERRLPRHLVRLHRRGS